MRRRARTCCTATKVSKRQYAKVNPTYQCLDVEEEHADGVVARPVEREEVNQGVDRRSERTVQPTPALANQFGSRFGHIRLGLRGLDVCQSPPLILLRDELETENSLVNDA